MKKYQVTRSDETLSAITFNHYKGEFGYLEKVLEVNDNLASEGIFLSPGLIISLPNLPSQNTKARTSLWN